VLAVAIGEDVEAQSAVGLDGPIQVAGGDRGGVEAGEHSKRVRTGSHRPRLKISIRKICVNGLFSVS
jgi:hypothetical protein